MKEAAIRSRLLKYSCNGFDVFIYDHIGYTPQIVENFVKSACDVDELENFEDTNNRHEQVMEHVLNTREKCTALAKLFANEPMFDDGRAKAVDISTEYDPELRKNVIEEVLKDEKNFTAIAATKGISKGTLGKWLNLSAIITDLHDMS